MSILPGKYSVVASCPNCDKFVYANRVILHLLRKGAHAKVDVTGNLNLDVGVVVKLRFLFQCPCGANWDISEEFEFQINDRLLHD